MKLKNYIPSLYYDNRSMNSILDTEQIEIDKIKSQTLDAFHDNFALTATIRGIENYERILRITPDPATESIEFRRNRIIMRLGMFLPYTKFFLQEFLNGVFGDGNWNLVVDHLIYTIYIDVETNIYGLYEQTMKDVRELIPANLILFTKLKITQDVEKKPITSFIMNKSLSKHYTIAVRR